LKRKLQENEVFAAATECEALSLRMMNAVVEKAFNSAQSYGLKSKSSASLCPTQELFSSALQID